MLHLSLEFFNISKVFISASDDTVNEIKNKINKYVSFLLAYYWNACETDIQLENIIYDTYIDKIVLHTCSDCSNLVVLLSASNILPKL